jgi:hypothetical protein
MKKVSPIAVDVKPVDFIIKSKCTEVERILQKAWHDNEGEALVKMD